MENGKLKLHGPARQGPIRTLALLLTIVSGQAAHALEPPSPAMEHGLTRCGFREEFDDYLGIDIENTGGEGFNFYVKHFWSSRTVDSSEAVIENGVLTLECDENRAQGDLRSVFRIDETTFHGWHHDMATDGPVYFEARLRWSAEQVRPDPDGFPAFWAMPIEHFDTRANAPYHHYTELDFFEFNPSWRAGESGFLQGLPPWQREPGERWERYRNPDPKQWARPDGVIWPAHKAAINFDVLDPATGSVMTRSGWSGWQVVGCLVIPGDGTPQNPGRCISYFNGRKLKERIDTSMDGDGSWRESVDELSPEEVGFAPMPGMRHHRYYVVIGSGQWRTQWDWVRVWQSPAAGDETHGARNAANTSPRRKEYASHSELLPFARNVADDDPEKLVFINWHQLTHTDNNTGPESEHIRTTRTNRKIRHRVCRDVPLGRPARRDDQGDELPYKEWFMADFAADLRYANAIGADAVQPNAGSLDAGNPRGLRGYTLFLEACERAMATDPGFRTRIMVTQDFVNSPGTTYAHGQAIARTLHTALRGGAQQSGRPPSGVTYTPYFQEDKAASPALFRIDGNLAFSVWAYNRVPNEMLKGYKDELARLFGETKVLLIPNSDTMLGHETYKSGYTALDGVVCWGRSSVRTDLDAHVDGIAAIAKEVPGAWVGMAPRVGTTRMLANPGADVANKDPNSILLWENHNTKLFRLQCQRACMDPRVNIMMVGPTINDKMEGQGFGPGIYRQHLFYDLAAYYCQWFKSGSRPKIIRDCLYWCHRRQIVPDGRSEPMLSVRTGPVSNKIEVVGFLTAPASIEILIDGVVKASQAFDQASLDAAGGVVELYADAEKGQPSYRLIRNGEILQEFESDFAIEEWNRDLPYPHYGGGSSLRKLHPRRMLIDPLTDRWEDFDVDDWLAPNLGEPVPFHTGAAE